MKTMDCPGAPQRVLVADDEEDVCVSLKSYLQRKGVEVVTALDGLEAKRRIEEESFDCFLLDCSMPHVTGIELIQMARERNPHSKIVLISGIPSIDDGLLKQLGADQFIYKPIQLSEIDRLVFG